MKSHLIDGIQKSALPPLRASRSNLLAGRVGDLMVNYLAQPVPTTK